MFGGVVKEAIRLSTPFGANIFVGINNATPLHTLDVVNCVATVNALSIKNTAASSTIFTVTDAGNTTMSGTLTVIGVTTQMDAVPLNPTGSNTVLTVGGTAYSAATVQAAFAVPSTPVFTGNITLPTTVTAPTAGQLG